MNIHLPAILILGWRLEDAPRVAHSAAAARAPASARQPIDDHDAEAMRRSPQQAPHGAEVV